ncbi:MAG: nuclear transport factor 2 family protein [Candidatus Lambdaproteobacteria bacterium]|nr:nuclear transport factor 2 family protein [Candidatus Lambdaproteobacteria bacterium]
MEFAQLVKKFTRAVEKHDGKALASCFTPTGVYHDAFYGTFKGRAAIDKMLDVFHRDGKDYVWTMKDPVSNGKVGYARWEYFAYASTMPQRKGKKVVATGISYFKLRGGLVTFYREEMNTGLAFSQMGLPGSAMEKIFGKGARQLLAVPSAAKLRAKLGK